VLAAIIGVANGDPGRLKSAFRMSLMTALIDEGVTEAL
jgi:hypothetical protein